MKLFSVVLLVLIAGLAYDIWYGRNGIAQYEDVSAQLKAVLERSEKLEMRNQLLKDEIHDLRQGNLTVEELARSDLGMIKPEETFYRVIVSQPAK